MPLSHVYPGKGVVRLVRPGSPFFIHSTEDPQMKKEASTPAVEETGLPVADLDPTPAEAEEQGKVVKLFAALLNWDLRLTFHTSPDGTLYTVSDDDGAEILVRVTRANLENWIRQRQVREIYDQLPTTGVTLIVGAPMAGKTETALQLSAIAEEEGPVIYAALEDGGAVIRERIDDRFAAVILPEVPRLGADPGLMDVFEHHLSEMKAALMVIDSLAYVMPGNEDTYGEALKQLEAFAIDHDVRVLVVHHIRETATLSDLTPLVSATLHQQQGGQLPLLVDDETDKALDYRLISETDGGLVDFGIRTTMDGSGDKVYTITDTSTGETLLSNATTDEVRLWTNPDPLRAVLGRIANISRNLTAMVIDCEGIREQLGDLSSEVLGVICPSTICPCKKYVSTS